MSQPFGKKKPQPFTRTTGDYTVLRPFTDVDGLSYAAGDSYPANGPSIAHLTERGCLDAPVMAGAGGPVEIPVVPVAPQEVNDDAPNI